MTTYIGNNNSSTQQHGGYNYNTYVDNGPYAQKLKEAGQVAGSATLGGALATAAAPSGPGSAAVGGIIGQVIGYYIGGSAGEAAGFYVDNMSTAVKNFNTFFEELNSANSWMQPGL